MENLALQHANMARLAAFDSVELACLRRSSSSSAKLSSIEVELDSGEVIETGLVVESDGQKSFTWKQFGFDAWRSPYPHMGLVCTVQTTEPCPHAYQRFLRTGQLTLLTS